MHIGVPRERKSDENRVGLVPGSVRELVLHGHQVTIQSGAGTGIGVSDELFVQAGARIAAETRAVFAADMIVKVKEPDEAEIGLLREGQVLFTYLHLAADRVQTDGLLRSGATCIAYETVTGPRGGLPLLAPMSEVAGRMSIQVGAACLETPRGGSGVLLGGVPGVPPARVLVLGGGVSGSNAVRVALGMGAEVTVVDKSVGRLQELDAMWGGRVRTLYSTTASIEDELARADLVIGAILVPGAAAPKLVSREMLSRMRPGSALVDIAIDQGGCFATSRPTTHASPTYVEAGVVHYCVTNMPGAVPRTSAFALNNATLPHVLALADKGWRQALLDDAGLLDGLNVHAGRITCQAVAESQERDWVEARAAIYA
jgi:alanine dehydrogenase